MKINKLLLLTMLILVLPLVNAQPEFTFVYGEDANFVIPCEFDGGPCNTSATCDFTLRYPNQTYILQSSTMTAVGNGDYNHTINGTTLFKIGEKYPGKVHCTQGGYADTRDLYVIPTPSGGDRGIELFLIFSLASVFLLALAFITENEYVGFLSGVGLLLSGI